MRTVTGVLLGAALLLGAGCDAPLEPESTEGRRSGDAIGQRRRPSPRPEPADPAPDQQPAAPTPSIKVPKLPKPKDLGPVLGADISWPQCPKGMGIPQKRTQGSPMPVDAARYVILGLTNGPGFYPNPCLAGQTAWVKSRNLMAAAYSVISYPEQRHFDAYRSKGPFDGSTRLGALSNVGYQQAVFNLATMKRARLQSPIIWLDVEPVPEFDWPRDLTANAAVVRGAARGYTDAGYRIGAYSTQALWEHVVGGLRLGIPEWRAAGQTSRAEALRRCGPDRMFQGGDVRAGPVGRGGSRHERHLPRHLAGDAALVPPVLRSVRLEPSDQSRFEFLQWTVSPAGCRSWAAGRRARSCRRRSPCCGCPRWR